MEEVSKHNKAGDLWVVIKGLVYDLSKFYKVHPGGKSIVLQVAGKDATNQFDPFHPSDIIKRMLEPEYCLGSVDPATIRPEHIAGFHDEEDDEEGVDDDVMATKLKKKKWVKPELGQMLNVYDFESVAKRTMMKQGWNYYSSGADDEITLRENHIAFQRIWLRPRVLINVRNVNMSTKLLGYSSSLPLYITATALGKLAAQEGELAIVRAAHQKNIIYMLPTLSSYTLGEMINERGTNQIQFGQLYVNSDREKTKKYIEELEQGNCKALFITVDAPQLGRREKDMRNKFTEQGSNVQSKEDEEGDVNRDNGVARAISEFIDTSLCWEDLAWFRSVTKMKIVLKGVATWEDTILAYDAGVDGVVLSNHGGRQLDTARSGIEILAEVVPVLNRRFGSKWRSKFELFVDGGVRRGSDIFKAIALGATAVGIGRPVLYSLASYGQQGIEKMLQLFAEELTMVMRLMGTPTIQDINPSHVISTSLTSHFGSTLRDNLMLNTYEPLLTSSL
jgi:L-lactate dehydrogenase (cytochrome)